MDYKIILCGKSLYREIELKDDTQPFKIGNHKGCQIRIGKDLFDTDFEIYVVTDMHMNMELFRDKLDNYQFDCVIKDGEIAEFLATGDVSVFKDPNFEHFIREDHKNVNM